MLENLEAALKATGLQFTAYAWSEAPVGDYGVFGMDGENDLSADDKHAEKATEGTVDYFTRHAPAAAVAAIEGALEGVEGCAWYLNSMQFESDTGYLHIEWVVQVA